MHNRPEPTFIASYLLSALALLLILGQGLLAALFGGLLVFSLVHLIAPLLDRRIGSRHAKLVAVAIISSLIVTMLTGAVWGLLAFIRTEAGSLPALLGRMADIIETSRDQIPEWIRNRLPADAEALQAMLASWLREHAAEARNLGREAGRTIAHLLIGMVIGALAALHDTAVAENHKPLVAALHKRISNLEYAFRQIVFAQVRISSINTVFTAIFLAVALPLAGIHLPLIKTMVAITFFTGLLPVIGNLVSNTVIVIVSLSHSLQTAVIALAFLVTIHKLEYFLNARIIGTQINARAWELLAAMLAMEAVFGFPGIIAAPVLYAYVRKELTDRQLI